MRTWQKLALLSLLAGCKQMGTATVNNSGGPQQPPPAGSSMQFSDSEDDLNAGVMGNKFNFYNLPELWVRVIVPDAPHQTVLHLSFVSPRGWTAYQVDTPFTFDPNGGQMMMPGQQAPVGMSVIKTVQGGVAMDRGLAIPGSTLGHYAEDGDWTVNANIDGMPGTITATATVASAL
jgi:hypothetical protein